MAKERWQWDGKGRKEKRDGGGSVCARNARRSEVRERVCVKALLVKEVCKGVVCKSGVCVQRCGVRTYCALKCCMCTSVVDKCWVIMLSSQKRLANTRSRGEWQPPVLAACAMWASSPRRPSWEQTVCCRFMADAEGCLFARRVKGIVVQKCLPAN